MFSALTTAFLSWYQYIVQVHYSLWAFIQNVRTCSMHSHWTLTCPRRIHIFGTVWWQVPVHWSLEKWTQFVLKNVTEHSPCSLQHSDMYQYTVHDQCTHTALWHVHKTAVHASKCTAGHAHWCMNTITLYMNLVRFATCTSHTVQVRKHLTQHSVMNQYILDEW